MNVPIRCQCGALRGLALEVESAGKRMVCLCDDCQAYAHHLGRAADVLDANGGTEIVPMSPSRLQLTEGLDQLACVRLVENGMYRWYAACCRTPIANSMPSPRTPFAGMHPGILDIASTGRSRDEVLGPIYARVQGRWGIGALPPGTSQSATLGSILHTIGFLFTGVLRGRHKPSPFFDGRGQPVRVATVLTPMERDALRRFCGPRPTA